MGGDGSGLGKVSAVQTQGPERDPQKLYVQTPGVVVCTCNSSPGGVEKVMDPWDLLVSQLSLFGEFQANERPLFKK